MCILILALAGGAARADGAVPVSDYVRLHVVAADDGAGAQALKLRVRDAVLERARALLVGCADADAAWDTVRDSLGALELAALERARALGYGGGVRCEAGIFEFPDRRYGDVTVPAGRYRALRVVIGPGRGHNWWCVLYPSLCYPADYLEGGHAERYSILLNWLRSLFGGGAA